MLVPLAGPSGAPYEIVTTSDAGQTWQVQGPPAGWQDMATGVDCANATDCWIATSLYDANNPAGAYSEPTIESTHDGGATWSTVALPTAKPPISDVLTLSCPPSGDGCMGIGNLQDHFVLPKTPPAEAAIAVRSAGHLELCRRLLPAESPECRDPRRLTPAGIKWPRSTQNRAVQAAVSGHARPTLHQVRAAPLLGRRPSHPARRGRPL